MPSVSRVTYLHFEQAKNSPYFQLFQLLNYPQAFCPPIRGLKSKIENLILIFERALSDVSSRELWDQMEKKPETECQYLLLQPLTKSEVKIFINTR